jgi:hypothetical protein
MTAEPVPAGGNCHPICGNCRYHFPLEAALDPLGFRNCMALPYPQCLEFFSVPGAACTFPLLFTPRGAP